MSHCALDTCTYGADGKCLKGLGASCPNILTDKDTDEGSLGSDLNQRDDEEGASEDAQTIPFTETEPLYSGGPLEIADARAITRGSRTSIVCLAGMPESGKTTLLARLHQLFQAGRLGQYSFAGSRTLLRFEEINWMACLESGPGKPTTEHTSRRYDNTCLHTRVLQSGTQQGRKDLLLNDISGDTYPEAISASSVCETLLFLRRADHLAVVVDGAAMADRNRRHDHAAKALEFVQRALQTGQIGPWTILHLIISKLDILKAEKADSIANQAVQALENGFRARYESQVARVHRWRVAARPLDGTSPTTEEIAEMFSIWVSTSNRYWFKPIAHEWDLDSGRDFSRYGRLEESSADAN
jgi:hypothetical protein